MRSSFARGLAALLCLALPAAPMAHALDYRGDSGLGSKHNDMGFEGFQGFSNEVGSARDQAREKAVEAKKEADGKKSRAQDLKDTGDQIGKDRNQLLPQMQQAKQEDQRNSSGSSSLQKLLQKPYSPPKKYQKAIEALGLRNNGQLFYKGPAVQKKLYTEANQINSQAQQSFEKATQGYQAARQLQSFQRIAQARQAGMRNAQGVQGAGNNLAARSRSGGLGLGVNSTDSVAGGNLDGEGIGSGITDSSEKGVESDGSSAVTSGGGGGLMGSGRGSRGLASTSFDGNIDMKRKGGTDAAKGAAANYSGGPGAPEKSDLRRSLEKNFAALDALFDQVAGKDSGKPLAAAAASTGRNSGAAAESEPLETLNAVLQIHEPSQAEPVSESAEATAPSMVAMVEASSEVRSNGFTLEEDSLFQRVRQSYLRAAQSGRIAGH
jgi:hypothetical protein